jgi:uncharacterized protein YjbK
MAQDRERELKYRIPARADFLHLRDAPEWGARQAPKRQVNHYFDTPDLALARAHVLLRVREESRPPANAAPEDSGRQTAYRLTVKCAEEARPGYFDSLELEAELSEAVFQQALADPASLLDLPLAPLAEIRRRFGKPALAVIGRLENERVERSAIPGAPFAAFEVDRLGFGDGGEEYELEVEVDEGVAPEAESWIEAHVRGRGIRLEPEPKTKLERLLARDPPGTSN